MAMPRPSGKAFRIAEKVIPGMMKDKKSRSKPDEVTDSFSEVELMQTENIENKKGLVQKR